MLIVRCLTVIGAVTLPVAVHAVASVLTGLLLTIVVDVQFLAVCPV